MDGALKMHSGAVFDWYKKFCYRFGRKLDLNPNPSISRTLYQIDAEMTPGMFLSIWIVTVSYTHLTLPTKRIV